MTIRSHKREGKAMPKPTFLNLPEEKRRAVTEAAADEFARYGFKAASINRIVANSGISKGSFYQYFEDKLDVFKHLMDALTAEKTDFFKSRRPPSPNLDTFEYFRWLIKTGMEFNTAYPRVAQAVSRVLLTDGMYYGEEFAEYRKMSSEALAAMARQAMQRGEMDPSVDLELALMVMETWLNVITAYVLKEGAKRKDVLRWYRSPKTQEMIDKMLYVMEYGLRKTESQFVKS